MRPYWLPAALSMNRCAMRSTPCLLLVAWVLFFSIVARADEISDAGGVSIEQPQIVVSPHDGKHHLSFLLLNNSGSAVTLIGVESKYFTSATFSFRSSPDKVSILSSITVRSDEHLDLASSHQWFELDGVSTEISKIGLVPFTALLSGNRQIEAHAHFRENRSASEEVRP